MRKILYQVYLFVLSISGVLLYSCDGDETYDIHGDSSNKVYIVNSGMKSFSLLHTVTKSIADINLNFQLCCTQAAKEDLTVSIAIDNSMVDIYNKTYGTSYATIPEDAFTFEEENITILAEKQKANDNVRICIKKDRLRELTEENYLIPIRVKEVLGDAMPVTSVSYAVVTTSEDFDNWWDGATPESAGVTEIREGRENWTASFTNTDGGTNGASMSLLFDDNESTYSYVWRKSINNVPTDLIVDLGKTYNLAGIHLIGYHQGKKIYGIVISTSIDGKTWNEIGISTITSSNTEITAMLYTPLDARYVKYFFPGVSSTSTGVMVCEFRAYTLTE